MGKKIALLLGVSVYENENDLLPCEKDLQLMTSIISGSDKYDDFLILDGSPKSVIAKDKISAFIRKYQDQEVDEIFIYYTGHGTRHGDDFLYLFSDFDSSKIEQTALRNSEFDSMLKSLQPKLTVKVVDACQAGTEYIKSKNDLEVIFEKSSEDSFNKTYFFFSSSNSESSTALQDYSVFTKSFALALLDFEGQDIRYRDVMAYISDDQSVKKYQTPLFIQQADNTEIFCYVTPNLAKELKASILTETNLPSPDKANIENSSETIDERSSEQKLIDVIREKSKKYCSEDEAQKSLEVLVNSIEDYDWQNPMNSLYTSQVETLQYVIKLNSNRSIAKWIKESKEHYFANIEYDNEEYQTKEKVEIEESQSRYISSIFGNTKRTEYKPVTKYRNIISSFDITATSPAKSLVITLEPKEEILPWVKVFFMFVFSKSKLTLFFKYEVEYETSWEHRVLEEKNEWRTSHCDLKDIDSIRKLVSDAFYSIEKSILEFIFSSVAIDQD
ncbi:caspase family protein [Psychrobacter sp. SZ93C1]|uniref:caspase family protein n=1 Tax=Psychrobacter sp. SZ93C1 TaxID=2792058 RepID=UPI0018CD6048|nr:caspase family protein [Psychrobacter sp. SZ93C1]MBH0065173.1 caspase family protein [Psychrobacter sp. SZ93C1]